MIIKTTGKRLWAVKRAVDEYTERSIHLETYEDLESDTFELEFKVNWCAMGAQTPAVARKFADRLDRVCGLAEWLNCYRFVQDDWDDFDDKFAYVIREDYAKTLHTIIALLDSGDYNPIYEFLNRRSDCLIWDYV